MHLLVAKYQICHFIVHCKNCHPFTSYAYLNKWCVLLMCMSYPSYMYFSFLFFFGIWEKNLYKCCATCFLIPYVCTIVITHAIYSINIVYTISNNNFAMQQTFNTGKKHKTNIYFTVGTPKKSVMQQICYAGHQRVKKKLLVANLPNQGTNYTKRQNFI